MPPVVMNSAGARVAEQRRHHAHGFALHRERARLLVVGPLDEERTACQLVDLLANRGRNARVGDREVLLDVVGVARESVPDLAENGFLRTALFGEVDARHGRNVDVTRGKIEFGGRHRSLLAQCLGRLIVGRARARSGSIVG